MNTFDYKSEKVFYFLICLIPVMKPFLCCCTTDALWSFKLRQEMPASVVLLN